MKSESLYSFKIIFINIYYLNEINKKIVQGNYESIKNRKSTISYLTKTDSSCLTSLKLNNFGKKDEFFEELVVD